MSMQLLFLLDRALFILIEYVLHKNVRVKGGERVEKNHSLHFIRDICFYSWYGLRRRVPQVSGSAGTKGGSNDADKESKEEKGCKSSGCSNSAGGYK